MGWLEDLISETSGPRGSGTPGTWGTAIGRTLENFNRQDPEYARRREAEQLLTGKLEHQRLQNALASGDLEDRASRRAERAGVPDAERDVLGAYEARDPTVEWGEEEGAGVTRTAEGRPAAKSIAELLKRGAQGKNVGLMSRQSPDLMKALGFQSPADVEAAEMATKNVPGVGLVRERTGETVAKTPPPGPKLKIDRVPGKDGYYHVIVDETTGQQIGAPQKIEGVEPPGSKSVYTREDIDDQIRLEDAGRVVDGGKPMNALEKRQRYNDLARSAMLPEGANLVGSGSGKTIATGPPKTQPLPAGETANLADSRSLVAQLDEAERLFDPKYTGAVQGRWGAIKSMTVGSPERETELRTLVQSFKNQLLKARSGAAVTPQEYDRISAELPAMNDPDGVFLVKLRTARRLLTESISNREGEFAARGFRGGAPAATAPARAPATAPQTFNEPPPAARLTGRIITNPATGQRMKSDGRQWVPVP